jgi:hypothetical protein
VEIIGGIGMDIEKLKGEALQLEPEVRAYLARELLASLDTMSEGEIERLWLDEALHRDDDLDKGITKAYPAQEFFRRVRSRLK